jgi:cobyrinic acid a,c-diamide synthase
VSRGLIIAALRSGSGKTVLTLGLMRAFARRGLAVAGAKCGPDYIDPAFHAAATGRASYNLDSWAMSPSDIADLASATAADADLVIAEASMGLFDGVPGSAGRTGASADIAAATGWPILLLHDVSGQAQSAAAIVSGAAHYDPRIRIAGVILNKVGSERHLRLSKDAIEATGIPVVGALPRDSAMALPERHLGLVQASETNNLEAMLDRLAERVSERIDLDQVVGLAGPSSLAGKTAGVQHSRAALPPPGQRIAIARDQAFSFLYPHVAAGWRSAGAELMFFSPLVDEAPPAHADICWLPGGYPELHAGRLAAARTFLDGLRRFAERRPVHGECGGYMVLGHALTDAEGQAHAMAGLLPVATSFAKRKLSLGYRAVRLVADHPLGPCGTVLRGHEFHYATGIETPGNAPFVDLTDAYGGQWRPAGSRLGNVSGSFFHAIAREG